MRRMFLFWVIVIICLGAVIFFWRGPALAFLKNLLQYVKEPPFLVKEKEGFSELETEDVDLKIELPEEASQEVLGEATEEAAQKEGEQLSELDRIEAEVRTIERKVQVVEKEVEELRQREEALESIEDELTDISYQIEEISLQIEGLEASST